MEIWTEHGPIAFAWELGFRFSWADNHVGIYEISVNFAHWYFAVYVQFNPSKYQNSRR